MMHAAEHTKVFCGVLALDVAGNAVLLLYVRNVDQLVGDGVDDESGGGCWSWKIVCFFIALQRLIEGSFSDTISILL